MSYPYNQQEHDQATGIGAIVLMMLLAVVAGAAVACACLGGVTP